MANSIIEQQPSKTVLPVGQDVIFVVSNDDAVANQVKVKFVAEVHINDGAISLSNPDTRIGVFKTTPNNAGVGIFDFRNIVENYVKAEQLAGVNSTYKGASSDGKNHPIHLIDKFSLQTDVLKYFAVQFKVEFLGAVDSAGNQDDNIVRVQAGTAANTGAFKIINAYLKYTDVLSFSTDPNNLHGFGYDITKFKPSDNTKQFLTNLPTTLFANIEDYGTVAILQTEQDMWDNAKKIKFTYNKTDGTTATETITKTQGTGAFSGWSTDGRKQILYYGIYPGNLRNTSTTFQSLVSANTIQGGNYTVQLLDNSNTPTSKTYTINLTCPDERQFESIRLCWLNQWGAWDYFTFTKKSSQTINATETTYTQIEGTWNKRYYNVDGFRGGKKTFRRNATETIRINTDYISQDFNTSFEELINSPEVYMLDGFQTDVSNPVLNQYVTPVRLKTTSFITKTIANDKLIQYTFEIEKSLTLRSQTI